MPNLIFYELKHDPTQTIWQSIAEDFTLACNQLGFIENNCRMLKEVELNQKRQASDSLKNLTKKIGGYKW